MPEQKQDQNKDKRSETGEENKYAEASKKPDDMSEWYEQIRRRRLFGEDPENKDVSVYELKRRKRALFVDHLVCDIIGKHRLATFFLFLAALAAMTGILALLGDREGFIGSLLISITAQFPLLIILKNPKKALYDRVPNLPVLIFEIVCVVSGFIYSITKAIIAAI